MVRFLRVLQPKYELFRRNDERLRNAPNPERARRRFQERLVDTRRYNRLRLVCYAGLYLTAIVAFVGLILRNLAGLAGVADALGAIGSVSSSLTVLFVIGLFALNRILAHLEVELYFYSAESRLASPRRAPAAAGLRHAGTAIVPSED